MDSGVLKLAIVHVRVLIHQQKMIGKNGVSWYTICQKLFELTNITRIDETTTLCL